MPQLSALAYWAPSRLLQATALLTGAAGGHQAVRAYALRSLTTMATPEEVSLADLIPASAKTLLPTNAIELSLQPDCTQHKPPASRNGHEPTRPV